MNRDARAAARIVRAAILNSANGQSRPPSQSPANSSKPRRLVKSRFNIFIRLRNERALVYNSMYDTFALWDPGEIDFFEGLNGEPIELTGEQVRPYLVGGYLIPEGTDELQALEEEYRSVRFAPGRMTLTIAPTMACNFGCDYCFQGQDKPRGKMLPEVKEALYAFLERKLPELKQLGIAWYGGEPLMARPTILELSDRMIPMCDAARVSYNGFMVTNGFNLNGAVAKELYDRRVTAYQVTLDGPEDYHDGRRYLLSGKPTYKRIVENLKEVLSSLPVMISIRVNIDRRNADRIRELIDDLADQGIASGKKMSIYFAPVEAITEGCHGCSDVTFGKKIYGQLEAELIRYAHDRGLSGLPKPPRFFGNCQAVRTNGWLLTPTGDLHKCWDTVNVPSQRVGTIFEIDKAYGNELHQKWINWTPFANNVCRSCKILPNCCGSCAYKFVHADKTSGEAGALPCPSWKFNLNERLFLRAEKMGIVQRDDWDEKVSPTSPDVVGANHTFASVAAGSDGRERHAFASSTLLPVIH